MVRSVTVSLAVILAVAASSAAADDLHIYRPEKAASAEVPAPGDGVLTRTIVIQSGDTLAKLSRRYSGRGSFFPQILLFNRIENPDLIYAGKTLRVPVTRSAAAAEAAGRSSVSRSAHVQTKRRVSRLTGTNATARTLFNRGMRAFAKGQYREAINFFDRYLTAYPDTPDASEAALYRADCYLRLSGGR